MLNQESFDEENSSTCTVHQEHGTIQPLIVMKEGSVYKIIAGERRWRAARLAGLKKVPAIERSYTSYGACPYRKHSARGSEPN